MKKNLKLAVVLIITLASMNVNAQKKAAVKTSKPTTENKTAKPTKQETMDWIAGKMKENLLERYKFSSYNNGVFTFTTALNGNSTCTSSIDLNKVTGISNEYSNDFYVAGKALQSTSCPDRRDWSGVYENISISGPNYNEYHIFFNFTPNQALVERLKKAFTTLVEYNSTRKGADEKF